MCVCICVVHTCLLTYVLHVPPLHHLLFFSLTPQVRSMGALLKFLDKHRVGVELEDTSVRIPLLAVKHFSLWVSAHTHTHTHLWIYVQY